MSSCTSIRSVIELTGFHSARYHIGYPTFVRLTAGVYGSLVFVFIRGVRNMSFKSPE